MDIINGNTEGDPDGLLDGYAESILHVSTCERGQSLVGAISHMMVAGHDRQLDGRAITQYPTGCWRELSRVSVGALGGRAS
jgi:hypothetical protein